MYLVRAYCLGGCVSRSVIRLDSATSQAPCYAAQNTATRPHVVLLDWALAYALVVPSCFSRCNLFRGTPVMKLVIVVAALLAMSVEAAMAQSLGISNVILLDRGRNYEKDLSVSDEVARNLALLRDEYRIARQKAHEDVGLSPNPGIFMTAEQRKTSIRIGSKLNEEYVPKAVALLSPEQITRLRQIDLQIDLRDWGLQALTNRALELSLTGNQRRSLDILKREYSQVRSATSAGNTREATSKLQGEYLDKAIELLTEEQRAMLIELQGRDYLGR
jgi:hypothetical protein